MFFSAGAPTFAFADVPLQPVLRQLPDRITQRTIAFRKSLRHPGAGMRGAPVRDLHLRFPYSYHLWPPSPGPTWGHRSFSALPSGWRRPLRASRGIRYWLGCHIFMHAFQYFYLNPMTPSKSNSNSFVLHMLLP
jgi:hypothetical protein